MRVGGLRGRDAFEWASRLMVRLPEVRPPGASRPTDVHLVGVRGPPLESAYSRKALLLLVGCQGL